LPILKKAIVNFHDPFPVFWYVGSKKKLTSLELYKMKEMHKVVSQARACMSPAQYMSNDMEYLYGSKKKFHTLPHQFAEEVFDLSDSESVLRKGKKITIAYHGAIQFGRNIEIVLDAYQELIESNSDFKQNTEFVLRMKGIDLKKLSAKYNNTDNIIILETLNFSNSCYEQKHIADINIILENGPLYCNILVGKAPFLGAIAKPILSISPERSELRNIITDDKYIANCNDKNEIRQKLENLILSRLNSDEPVYPFGNYFNDKKFAESLKEILSV
jgi:glycosyltransferase involved in cell wall biosynthesis